MNNNFGFNATLAFLFALPLGLMAFKLAFTKMDWMTTIPQEAYEVQYQFTAESESPFYVKTYLPKSNRRQEIRNAANLAGALNFSVETVDAGKVATWRSEEKQAFNIGYSFTFVGKSIRFNIDKDLPLESNFDKNLAPFLVAEEHIQAEHEKIVALKEQLVGNKNNFVKPYLTAIYQHVLDIPAIQTAELTDALTTLELNEASCNGKSRLFVALCRAAGIPARTVGGLILQNGAKKTSHLWAEAYVYGTWIPFDALNGHFAKLPKNYLELYHGDEFLITRSADMIFDYQYIISKKAVAHPALEQAIASGKMAGYSIWTLFGNTALPFFLLRFLMLMPLAAVIVALFRNVIGMKTFGVFLPALIALSLLGTGFSLGIALFTSILLFVSLIHFPLERWGLLYTPKLVVMLTGVVLAFLVVLLLGKQFQPNGLSILSFFPLVILALTAERFARTVVEDGYFTALKILFQTLIVTSFCYLIFRSKSAQVFMFSFPETLLILVGIMLLLGRWIGLRLSEYKRFQWIEN